MSHDPRTEKQNRRTRTLILLGAVVLILAAVRPHLVSWLEWSEEQAHKEAAFAEKLGIESSHDAIRAFFDNVFVIGAKQDDIFDVLDTIEPKELDHAPVPGHLHDTDARCYAVSFMPSLDVTHFDRTFCFDSDGILIYDQLLQTLL